MSLIAASNAYKAVMHKIYKNDTIHLWSKKDGYNRTVCGIVISENDLEIEKEENCRPSEVNCKRCLAQIFGKDRTGKVRKGEFVDEDLDNYWHPKREERSKKLNALTRKWSKNRDLEGGIVEESVQFANGCSVSIQAYEPEYGECGDSHLSLRITDMGYGKLRATILDLNPNTAGKVIDAIIYLLSKVKNHPGMRKSLYFHDPDEVYNSILVEKASMIDL